MQCEIIDFYRPTPQQKRLFIANLPSHSNTFDPEDFLHATFSKFGLVHDIKILDDNTQSSSSEPSTHAAISGDNSSGKCFGLVTFYSSKSAANAKKQLAGRLYVENKLLNVVHSTKIQTKTPDWPTLFYTKCYELANFYLGFNGWSLRNLQQRSHEVHSEVGQVDRIESVCAVELTLPAHSLKALGFGTSTQKCESNDSGSKPAIFAKGKKVSYQLAVQDAFSKVLLVVLENGKVFPEINTTVEENMLTDMNFDADNLLQVNDLDEAPAESEDDLEMDENDAINKQILAELENDDL